MSKPTKQEKILPTMAFKLNKTQRKLLHTCGWALATVGGTEDGWKLRCLPLGFTPEVNLSSSNKLETKEIEKLIGMGLCVRIDKHHCVLTGEGRQVALDIYMNAI